MKFSLEFEKGIHLYSNSNEGANQLSNRVLGQDIKICDAKLQQQPISLSVNKQSNLEQLPCDVQVLVDHNPVPNF